MIEIGRPLPADLKKTLHEVTDMTDWGRVSVNLQDNDPENYVSAHTLRVVVVGNNPVSKRASRSIELLIELAKAKVENQHKKVDEYRKVLSNYSTVEAH